MFLAVAVLTVIGFALLQSGWAKNELRELIVRQANQYLIGEEIAPRLVARFSRQFGPEPFDEATVEYYLSRILRLRATFSDAQSLSARTPFRRIERAGIDLLVFLSF